MTIRRKTKQQEKNIHKILSTRDGKTMKKQNGKNFCLNIFFKSQSSFQPIYKTLSIRLHFFSSNLREEERNKHKNFPR